MYKCDLALNNLQWLTYHKPPHHQKKKNSIHSVIQLQAEYNKSANFIKLKNTTSFNYFLLLDQLSY